MARIRPTLHGSQLGGGNLSFEEKVVLAGRTGYPAVDFSLAEAHAYGDNAKVRNLLDANGVVPGTIGGVVRAGVFSPEEEFATALEHVHALAADVVALGGSTTGGGISRFAAMPKAEAWPIAVERLKRMDAALDGTGVRIGLEFLGCPVYKPETITHWTSRGETHPFIQSLAETNEILHEVKSRNVGITLDSYHWYGSDGTIAQIRETPGAWITLLHINDGKSDVARHDLHDFDRIMPGEGNFPLADWLSAISHTGFDGFVALEVLGPRMAGIAPEPYATAGLDSLRPIYAKAGLSLT